MLGVLRSPKPPIHNFFTGGEAGGAWVLNLELLYSGGYQELLINVSESAYIFYQIFERLKKKM